MTRRLASAGCAAVTLFIVLAVSGPAQANPAPPQSVEAVSAARPPLQERVDPREMANLRQVNTYLLQAVAKFRRGEEELKAKIAMLTEATARLHILLKEQDALRRQAVAAEGERRKALKQLSQERQITKAQREQTAALSKLHERLNASLKEAQRKLEQAEAAARRARGEQTMAAEEHQHFTQQLTHTLELEQDNAQLRQHLVGTQEELERLRHAYAQVAQGEMKQLQEDALVLQAKLVTLTEENRRRQQALEHARQSEQERQSWLQERAQQKLETDTLRQMLQRERGELHRELGAAYTKLQIFDKAIRAYESALEADPDHAQTHYYLGLLYEHAQHNDERAVAHLQRYLALSPKLPPKTRKEIEYVINMLQTKEPPTK